MRARGVLGSGKSHRDWVPIYVPFWKWDGNGNKIAGIGMACISCVKIFPG